MYHLFPVDGGAAVPAKGLGPNDLLARMPTSDSVYTYDRAQTSSEKFLMRKGESR